MKEYDLIVLGGGSGGIATANRAAMHGAKVAVIEGRDLGGTCVNRGCVPKKIGWYGARVSEAIHKYAPNYGFDVTMEGFDYTIFLEARDGYVSRSRASYDRQFEKNGIEVYSDFGRFIGPKTIEVGQETLQGKYVMIATGGKPSRLDVPGSDLLDNSDDFFEWQDLPESVAFIGAGYIAVELSQMMAAFGVESHLVVRHDRPLRHFDHMLSDLLMEEMVKEGVQLHTHTNFDAYERTQDGKIACYQDGQLVLTVDRVVQAIGRTPNTNQLGLEQTGVELDDKGHIIVNEGHETDEPGVYAVGDVIDRIDLTPVAIRAGRRVAEYLFNDASDSEIDYTNVPSVIFSHPAIGTIGLSEEEAIETYGSDRIKVYKSRFYAMYTSAGGHRQPCDFKLVCLDDQETVIGLHGIGEGVDEMIQGFGVAMKMKATKADFDSVIAIHPTGAEEFVTMR